MVYYGTKKMIFFFFFAPTEDGSVGKTWTLHLTHLNLSPAASSPSLVGIHKGWPTGLNLSALLGGWRSLANSHFSLTKKKKKTLFFMVLSISFSMNFVFELMIRNCKRLCGLIFLLLRGKMLASYY